MHKNKDHKIGDLSTKVEDEITCLIIPNFCVHSCSCTERRPGDGLYSMSKLAAR